MRLRKKIKRNLEVACAEGLYRFARTLPRGAGLRLFSALGGTFGRILREEREQALRNLEIAFPETPPAIRRAMAGAMFKALGRNAFEFLTLEGSSRDRILSRIERVEGLEHLERARATGKGLIVVTGHIGCWELMAAYFACTGYSVNVVARELWEKRINDRVVRIRNSMGYQTIDRDTGGKEIARLLRNGGAVALLIDQHTRVSGVYVPFFNRPAHTPIAAARLAMATGAEILPMAIYMTAPGRHTIRILPALEQPSRALGRDEAVHELTASCSRAVEDLIRFDPKQWVWFHKRWRQNPVSELSDAVVN